MKFVFLYLFWFLLSGYHDPFHLSLGLISVCGVLYLSKWDRPSLRAAKKSIPFSQAVRTFVRFIRYGFWLLTRIFLASIHVIKLILNPRMPIEPSFIRHKTLLSTEDELVIFANSITLTPGTITAEVNGDELVVHQLDIDSAGDIDSGLMERKISQIFKRRKSRSSKKR